VDLRHPEKSKKTLCTCVQYIFETPLHCVLRYPPNFVHIPHRWTLYHTLYTTTGRSASAKYRYHCSAKRGMFMRDRRPILFWILVSLSCLCCVCFFVRNSLRSFLIPSSCAVQSFIKFEHEVGNAVQCRTRRTRQRERQSGILLLSGQSFAYTVIQH
jgi:hypothetical protein